MTIEANPSGLLALDGGLLQVECQEGQALLAPKAQQIGDRQWKFVMA